MYDTLGMSGCPPSFPYSKLQVILCQCLIIKGHEGRHPKSPGNSRYDTWVFTSWDVCEGMTFRAWNWTLWDIRSEFQSLKRYKGMLYKIEITYLLCYTYGIYGEAKATVRARLNESWIRGDVWSQIQFKYSIFTNNTCNLRMCTSSHAFRFSSSLSF